MGQLSRQERRERALDQIFGANRNEYMGNIWGWKFSLFGFVFILFAAIFAYVGTKRGLITWEQDPKDNQLLFGKPNKDTKKDTAR